MPSTPIWTLNKVIRLLKVSSPKLRQTLFDSIPWERVIASPDELKNLPHRWHFILKKFLSSNPQYFQENINSMGDLMDALMIGMLSFEQQKVIVQQKSYLINAAKPDEIKIFMAQSFELFSASRKGLNLEDFLKFCKKYVSDDKEALIVLMAKIGNDQEYAQKILSSLLPAFSLGDRKYILDKYSYCLVKEIGLIMGLKGYNYERSSPFFGNLLTKRRFEQLSPESSSPLAFHLIKHYQDPTNFYNPIQNHGDLRSIHASWQGHDFSFHLIRDENKNHLIYVNRGEQHELASEDETSVTVFTFQQPKNQNTLIHHLVETLKSTDKTAISQFINTNLMPYKNGHLSAALRKSAQKTDNCTVANANITLHFDLAAREMKQSQCSFLQAYKSTKPRYKIIRMEDRAQAFYTLVTGDYIRIDRKDALSQIMKKMIIKDAKGKDAIHSLLAYLSTRNPSAVSALLEDLCLATYDISAYEQLLWMEACINILVKLNLYSAEEYPLVEPSFGLLGVILYRNIDLIPHLNTNPSSINLLPQKDLWQSIFKVDETVLSHLSIKNIKFIIKEIKKQTADSSATLALFTTKLSIKHIHILLQNNDISAEDLSKNSAKRYYHYCKYELIRIINKNLETTKNYATRMVAKSLLHQLKMIKNLIQLTPILHQAEEFLMPIAREIGTEADFKELKEIIECLAEPIRTTKSIRPSAPQAKSIHAFFHDNPLSTTGAVDTNPERTTKTIN